MSEGGLFSLRGRRALITGANSGIGQAIAAELAAAGADLVLHYHGDRPAAERVAEDARAAGAKCSIVPGDFCDRAAPGRVAEEALAGGPLDILILNAAIERRRPWREIDAAHIEQHVAANFSATLLLAQALLPAMMERGWGRVVALGSIMAARPRSETLIYAAMKSAQFTALQSLARDTAAKGVTINVVSPGAIRTEVNGALYDDTKSYAAITAKIPAGRPGTPRDCVGPVLMLCSEAGSYVNGVNLPVDGGWAIGDPPGALPGAAGDGAEDEDRAKSK